jgi:hypothetical protein
LLTTQPSRSSRHTTAVPDKGSRPSTTLPKTKPTTEAKAKPKVFVIREGDWLVGDDVPGGTYVSKGAKPGVIMLCTWTVKASDDTGAAVLDFGTSQRVDEQGRVKLKTGNAFETSGCENWIRK